MIFCLFYDVLFFLYRYTQVNDSFTGLTYELATSLQPALNFTMEIAIEESGIYGQLLDNGTWLGLVGRLDRREADISIMDFSITETRSKVRTTVL